MRVLKEWLNILKIINHIEMAEKMQYNNMAEARTHHNIPEKLAEEFLDKGYKGFAKLSDLNKIGSELVFKYFKPLRNLDSQKLMTGLLQRLKMIVRSLF